MFDIGFFEILIIACIALLVIGPDKLPAAARTAGLWVGKARRMIQGVQQDIDRQIRVEEMLSRLEKENAKIKSEMHSFEQTITDELSSSISGKSNLKDENASPVEEQQAPEQSEEEAHNIAPPSIEPTDENHDTHVSALKKQQHND